MTGTGVAAPTGEYAEVYAERRRGLLRFASLLTGNAALAEDAVAEAFARVYPKWRQGRVHDLDAYLKRAVVNETTNSFRTKMRDRRQAERLRPVRPEYARPTNRTVTSLLGADGCCDMEQPNNSVVGTTVVQFGGDYSPESDENGAAETAVAVDVANDRQVALPGTGQDARRGHAQAWTGLGLFVWGGTHYVAAEDGGRREPLEGGWFVTPGR